MGKVEPEAGEQDTVTAVPYWSVAVGAVHDSTAPEEVVAVSAMSVGVPVMTGRVVPALTFTVNVVDAALPFASVAVQVTVVVPIGKTEPDAGEQDTATDALYWSFAVGSV
jgi:hypothetical protein